MTSLFRVNANKINFLCKGCQRCWQSYPPLPSETEEKNSGVYLWVKKSPSLIIPALQGGQTMSNIKHSSRKEVSGKLGTAAGCPLRAANFFFSTKIQPLTASTVTGSRINKPGPKRYPSENRPLSNAPNPDIAPTNAMENGITKRWLCASCAEKVKMRCARFLQSHGETPTRS